MKKSIVWGVVIALGIGSFLGRSIYYSRLPKEETLSLEGLTSQLNSERKELIAEPIQYDIEDFQKALEPNDFTQEEFATLFQEGEKRAVTKEEAMEDINVLFRVLSQSYGGYIYFGGNERFKQAKQEILMEVHELSDKQISNEVLEQIIRNGLDFLVDNHFWINHNPTSFSEQYCYYAVGVENIEKDTRGYYLLEEDKKYYIEETLSPYIKPTIGKEGKLEYGLFAVVTSEEKETLPTTVVITKGNASKEKQIYWELCDVGGAILDEKEYYSRNYSYKEVDDIPVVSYRRMEYTAETDQFIEEGISFRNREVAILDLRGNTGGSPLINYKWLYQITGNSIYPKQIGVRYNNLIRIEAVKWPKEIHTRLGVLTYDYDDSRPDFEEQIKKYSTEEEAWLTCDYSQGVHWTENKTLWFVLVNKEVYSAGEAFLRQLETMSNVILVGTNSNGCLTTGNPYFEAPVYLPHSKISIVYGDELIVANDMKGYDARGTLPDLYIANEDALDAVVRCYEYYKETL